MGSGLCNMEVAQVFNQERAEGLLLRGHSAGSEVVLRGPVRAKL